MLRFRVQVMHKILHKRLHPQSYGNSGIFPHPSAEATEGSRAYSLDQGGASEVGRFRV